MSNPSISHLMYRLQYKLSLNYSQSIVYVVNSYLYCLLHCRAGINGPAAVQHLFILGKKVVQMSTVIHCFKEEQKKFEHLRCQCFLLSEHANRTLRGYYAKSIFCCLLRGTAAIFFTNELQLVENKAIAETLCFTCGFKQQLATTAHFKLKVSASVCLLQQTVTYS